MIYREQLTYNSFKEEWTFDDLNIPVHFFLYDNCAELTIYQPRKDVIFKLEIKDGVKYRRALKKRIYFFWKNRLNFSDTYK